MKKISTYLIALFLPFCMLAQDDYCSCMEQQNDVDEWGQFIKELDQTIEKKIQSPQLIFLQVEEEAAVDRKSLPVEEESAKVSVEQQKKIAVHSSTKTDTHAKKAQFKKRKKSSSSKLKTKKRVKKYRGKCPAF